MIFKLSAVSAAAQIIVLRSDCVDTYGILLYFAQNFMKRSVGAEILKLFKIRRFREW